MAEETLETSYLQAMLLLFIDSNIFYLTSKTAEKNRLKIFRTLIGFVD
jgi:hypothetical protein